MSKKKSKRREWASFLVRGYAEGKRGVSYVCVADGMRPLLIKVAELIAMGRYHSLDIICMEQPIEDLVLGCVERVMAEECGARRRLFVCLLTSVA
jgi:hypothetical protein